MAQKSRRETGIDAVGRFVEKQHLRVMQQGAHERQLLLHAAGKIGGPAVAERLHARHAEQLLHRVDRDRPWGAEQVGVEDHVLVDGEIAIQAEALGHVADAVLDGIQLAGDVVAGDPGFAFGGIEQAAEQPQRGGLPGAVRPDDAEDLAPRDLEVEMIDGGQTRRNGASG